MKFKIQFQGCGSYIKVLNSHMWLVATILDSVGLGNDRGNTVQGYWGGLGQGTGRPGFVKDCLCGSETTYGPDETSRVGEAGEGDRGCW